MTDTSAIIIRTLLEYSTSVTFNNAQQRWEAHCSSKKYKPKNPAYGKTKEEATEMLRQILENIHFGRDELYNLPEHENSGKEIAGRQSSRQELMAVTTYNYFNDNQGIIATGTINAAANFNVSISSSVQKLRTDNPDLADRIEVLSSLIKDSMDIEEPLRVEVLDEINNLTGELKKPSEERLLHRIANAMTRIPTLLKDIPAYIASWNAVETLIKAHGG